MINTIPTRKNAHMRGIKQAIEEIKQADPYTALTGKSTPPPYINQRDTVGKDWCEVPY